MYVNTFIWKCCVWCFALKELMSVTFINVLFPLGQLTYISQQRSSRKHLSSELCLWPSYLTWLHASSCHIQQLKGIHHPKFQPATSRSFISDGDTGPISRIFAMHPQWEGIVSAGESEHYFCLKQPVNIRTACSPAALCPHSSDRFWSVIFRSQLDFQSWVLTAY